MKKKEYQKPAMRVVKLQQQARLLAGSIFTITSTNFADEDEDLIYGGGGEEGDGDESKRSRAPVRTFSRLCRGTVRSVLLIFFQIKPKSVVRPN